MCNAGLISTEISQPFNISMLFQTCFQYQLHFIALKQTPILEQERKHSMYTGGILKTLYVLPAISTCHILECFVALHSFRLVVLLKLTRIEYLSTLDEENSLFCRKIVVCSQCSDTSREDS